jgi:hypothetical protein
MKSRLMFVALWLALLGILVSAVGCVHVETPPKSASEQSVEVLGGSNGYVLLKHSNGKFFIVTLENGNVREVTGLPQEAPTMTVH